MFVIQITNSVGSAYIKELILDRVKVTHQMIINTCSNIDDALRFADETYVSSIVITLQGIIIDKTAKFKIVEVEK